MKKIKYLIVIIFIFCLGIYAVRHYDIHLRMNSEYTSICILKGGYRSWTIRYSHGRIWRNEKWINLWKWPSFHHCDVRELIKSLQMPKKDE